MKHRPSGLTLNTLANEVPGGAELAKEAAKLPEVLRVTDTQLKFMRKFELVVDHGGLVTLPGSSVRVELTK